MGHGPFPTLKYSGELARAACNLFCGVDLIAGPCLPASPGRCLIAGQARRRPRGEPCRAPLRPNSLREVQRRTRRGQAGAVRPLRQRLAPVLPVAAAGGATGQGLDLPRVPLKGWVGGQFSAGRPEPASWCVCGQTLARHGRHGLLGSSVEGGVGPAALH